MNGSKYKMKPRYGAFELKAKYRRNMLLGTMLSAMLAIATTACAFLFTQSDMVRIEINPKDNPDGGRVQWERPPKTIPPKPDIGEGRKRPITSSKGSNIVPVVEDESFNDDVQVFSMTDQFYTGPVGNDTGSSGSYIDNPYYGNGGGGLPDYPAPDSFVIYEMMPEMIYEHPPDYPRIAQTAGLIGEVWIKALVDIDGSVRDAMIFVSSNSKAGFDEAALKAAYKCKYKPGIQNGRPVPVWVSYKVDFVLEGSW